MEPSRTRYLIDQHFNGTLTAAEVEELSRLVVDDAAAREEFWRSADFDHLMYSALEPGNIADDREHRLRPMARIGQFFSKPTPLSMTIAALVIGLLVTAMAMMVPPFYRQLTHRGSDFDVTTAPVIVAELTGSHEAVWAEGQIGTLRGAHLTSGHQMELKQGLAEVKFHSGARLVLDGPCIFQVENAMSGTLRRGKLRAYVPPAAAGFTIETPLSVITDLGTEFGVDVADETSTNVHVFQGRVEVATLNAGAAAKVESLRAGEAVSLQQGRSRPLRMLADAAKFRKSLPTVRKIVVQNRSFEDDGRDCNAGRLPYGWQAVGSLPHGRGCEDHVSNGNFVAGADGRFVGYVIFEPTADGAPMPALVQNLEHSVVQGATYRLTVSVGRRRDADVAPRRWPATAWGIGLFDADSGQALATETGELSVSGELIPQALLWTASAADVGKKLQIRLFYPPAPSGGQVNFDNIQLLEIVPEDAAKASPHEAIVPHPK
jgi:hypothetical protein